MKKLSHLKRKKKRNFEFLGFDYELDFDVNSYIEMIKTKKVKIFDGNTSYEEELSDEEIRLYLTFIKIYLGSTKNKNKQWQEVNKFYNKYNKIYKKI